MPTIAVGGREGLRGLGGELIRLDFQAQRGESIVPGCAWVDVFSSIVAVADRVLHDALQPYNDPALLESHGEQLLDFVIRLASPQEWKRWVSISVNIAAITGATDVLLRLFACYGESVDDDTLMALLGHAATGGSAETVSALIAAGAGPLVLAVDEVTWPLTALHRASQQGHRSCVATLIEAGAPVDSRHGLGGTALTEAVQHRHKGVVRELIGAGADVNTIIDSNFHRRVGFYYPYDDCTPLCIAVERSDEEMVKILLEAGADPTKGPPDDLPLHIAASRGSCVILTTLLLAGASVSSVDTEGRSALHIACAYNRPDAVDLLLRHNSSVASLSSSGLSPMDAVGLQVLALRQQGRVPTRPAPPSRPLTPQVIALQLQQRGISASAFNFGPKIAHPSTLNSAETSTVDKICDMLQPYIAWGRRGWLVMMRSRSLAEATERPDHSDADNVTLPVRDISLARVPSSKTAGSCEEGGTERALHDGGHSRTDWSAAVVWLLQGPDESLFRNTIRYL